MESRYVVLDKGGLIAGDYSDDVRGALDGSEDLRGAGNPESVAKYAHDEKTIITITGAPKRTEIEFSRSIAEPIGDSERKIGYARRHVSSLLDKAGFMIH